MLGRNASWLIKEILNFEMCREAVIERLTQSPKNHRELAFQTILRNRVQRGGILAPGASLMLNGENGRGVASRWYPETLARRIEHVRSIAERIEFHECDAFKIVNRYSKDSHAVWFIDPPYTARGGKRAGSRLYTHNEVDHSSLFAAAAAAAGSVMLTYDDAEKVRRLSERYGLTCQSIPMKNTHHEILEELAITNERVRGESCKAAAQWFSNELVEVCREPSLFSLR